MAESKAKKAIPSPTLLLADPERFLAEAERERLRLMTAARRKGLSQEDAEDLVQDVMIRLLRWPPSIEAIPRAASLALEHSLRDFWRARQRETPQPVEEEAVDSWPAVDLAIDVSAVVSRFDPVMREALLLSADGYSLEEISEATGQSESWVKRQLKEARASLAEVLNREP